MAQDILHLDFETRSEVDLPKCGSDVYANHPSTEVIIATWAVNAAPVKIWQFPDGAFPTELSEAILDPEVLIKAFNAPFEKDIINHTLQTPVPATRFHDVMAHAYSFGFSGSLGAVGEQVGLPQDQQKLAAGKRLITKFCKPRRLSVNNQDKYWDWVNSPDQWQAFCEYGIRDTEAERAIDLFCEGSWPMPEDERALWLLDRQINERGLPIDLKLVEGALAVEAFEKETLKEKLIGVTGLDNPNSGPQMLGWLEAKGVLLPNLQKATVEDFLKSSEDHQTEGVRVVREALKLRQSASKTSTAKWGKIKQSVGKGARLRNTLQMNGAGRTGRWAGRGAQYQNVPQGNVRAICPTFSGSDEEELNLIMGAANVLTQGDPLFVSQMYPDVMGVLSGAIRQAVTAKQGNTLVASDLSSIESVVLAWVAGCHSKLDIFIQGRDTYKVFAAQYYQIPETEVTPKQRKFSKPPELGCFAAGTEVLTQEGWLPIELVSAAHKVYDGAEWVSCDGAVDQGTKACVWREGVVATPDHLILTGDDEWIKFQDLTGVKVSLATNMVNGLLKGTIPEGRTGVDVLVGPGNQWTGGTCVLGKPSRACCVRTGKAPLLGRERSSWASLKNSMTDLLTRDTPHERVASIYGTRGTQTTAVEGSRLTLKAWIPLFGTLSPCRAGRTLLKRLTGSITKAVTQRGTFVSLTGGGTLPTRGLTSRLITWGSRTLRCSFGGSTPTPIETKGLCPAKSEKVYQRKKSSQTSETVEVRTFDVLNAGPRNRFTIRTTAGPVVVHNCGYGLGAKGLMAYADGFGVKLTQDEAQNMVNVYRGMYVEVVECWAWLIGAAERVTATGISEAGYRVEIGRNARFLHIKLPSGRFLFYDRPELSEVETPWGETKMGFTYMGMNQYTRKYERISTHGGKLVENVVQAIARDVLKLGIFECTMEGFDPILLVHDEIVAEVPLDDPYLSVDLLNDCLTRGAEWTKGLPLRAAGWSGKRYRKD